jgi:VanZ family protein
MLPTPLLPWLLQARHRRHWRLLLVLLLGVVSWFAFKPSLPSQEWAHLDKLQHISAFATLGLVASLGWAPVPGLFSRVAAGLMAYGLFIEAVQTQLPSRTGSWADWVADLAGVALGLALARLMQRRR